MTSYQSRSQIQEHLKEMIPQQVSECKECDKLPQPLVELIMHNFQAKYVCYHKKTNIVEVGVEEQESIITYPNITSYTFRLEEAVSWLGESLRTDEPDLRFYAKLIAENSSVDRIDDVVLM